MQFGRHPVAGVIWSKSVEKGDTIVVVTLSKHGEDRVEIRMSLSLSFPPKIFKHKLVRRCCWYSHCFDEPAKSVLTKLVELKSVNWWRQAALVYWNSLIGDSLVINPLAPNDVYIHRTAQLTSRLCILNICSTNILTEYFKNAAHSPIFCSLQDAVYFIMLPFFGSCNIHILNTGRAKILKKISAPKVNLTIVITVHFNICLEMLCRTVCCHMHIQ